MDNDRTENQPAPANRAPDAAPMPAALLTFLIADVRGYTPFTYDQGDEAAARLADRLAELGEEVVARHDGRMVELRGDEVVAVFPSARNALRAALALQALTREAMDSDQSLPLKVGIGLDAGEAIPLRGGYRGGVLNLAARLSSLARAGEVLASDAVVHLARRIEGVTYRDRGQVQLKGFAEPVSVLEVVAGHGARVEGGAEAVQEGHQIQTPDLPIGGFLGALPGNALVGREDELTRVLEAVDATLAGAGRLVFLTGEPGAGKTRLGQEVTLHLRNRGFLLAAGSCFESRQDVPFYPFLDVLTALRDLAPADIRSQMPSRWSYLGRLLHEEGVAPTPQPSPDQDDQDRLFRSITGFLQALAQTTPLALLLDDLHWADQASLDLLVHLARHTRANRVLLLGTYRDVDVGRQHPLERTLHDLHRQGLVERVPVRRLNEADTAGLVAAVLGEDEVSKEFAALVYRHTEGNPFFTQEVLRALVERGDVYRQDGAWDRRAIEDIEVPEGVRAVIGQRLSHLQSETQELLREASVLGQSFSFDDLQVATGRDEDTLDAALTEAAASSLVRPAGKDQYSFSHGLIHGALYAELSPRRRRKLHRAAGDALAARKRQQRPAELAWHFLQGDEPERALPYVMQAGEDAEAVFAHAEATSRFRAAVELAQDIGDQATEARAWESLGNALEIQSRPDESLEALHAAFRVFRQLGDLEGEGRVTAGIASALMHLGQPAEAVARLQAALARLEGRGPTPVLARLSLQLSAVLYGNGHYDPALEAAQRASEVAELVGDTVTRVGAENYRGSVFMQTGRLDEARRVFEAMLPMSETIHDLGVRAHTVNDLASVCLISGRFSEAEHYFDLTIELQRQKDSPTMIAFALAAISWARFYSGRWQEARDANEQGLRLVQDLPPSWQHPFLLYVEGLITASQGDWDAATEHLQRALLLSQESRVLLPLIHRPLAEREILEGHPDLARARLEPLKEEQGDRSLYVAMMLPTLAWANVELGELERAQAIVSHLLEEEGMQFPLVVVDAVRVQALLLGRRGQWPEAQRAFDDAVSRARRMAYPYAEAAALYDWGVTESRMGDPSTAEQRLADALDTFQSLGAWPAVHRTEQALARIRSAATDV